MSFLGRLENNDIVTAIKVYRLLEVSVDPVSVADVSNNQKVP